jgi:hypothetical protein
MSSIENIINDREIRSLYHFTTNNGVLGILASKGIFSRKSLPEENYLEYIVKYNSADRKYDKAWLSYVNLSISRVNSEFFLQCNKWHNNDVWWCVLEIDPKIMAHEGVFFSSTNNIFPATVRSKEYLGLNYLFSDIVYGRYNKENRRSVNMPLNYTTDVQAEVLYPNPVPLSCVTKILVLKEEHQDILMGQQEGLDMEPMIPVVVEPNILPSIARA